MLLEPDPAVTEVPGAELTPEHVHHGQVLGKNVHARLLRFGGEVAHVAPVDPGLRIWGVVQPRHLHPLLLAEEDRLLEQVPLYPRLAFCLLLRRGW